MNCRFAIALTLGLALATVLGLVGANAQSFNCQFARTPDETTICQSKQLSKLDAHLSWLYSRRLILGSADQTPRLVASQRAWLESRIGCGANAGCIGRLYRQRIAFLSRK